METIASWLTRLILASEREEAQTVIEYALVVGLVSVVVVGVLAAAANGWITSATDAVADAL